MVRSIAGRLPVDSAILRSMMRLVLCLSLLSALVPAASAASTDAEETAEHRNLSTRVYFLWQDYKFDRLEALAKSYQDSDRRSLSGGYIRLELFYSGMSEMLSVRDPEFSEARWQPAYEEWVKQFPESPTPRVANAAFIYAKAWKARGSGYWNSVFPDKAKIYQAELVRCRDYLLENSQIASRDPHYYTLLARTEFELGGGHANLIQTFVTGLRKYPWYGQYYFSASLFLQPKWGGSTELLSAWVEQAVDSTRDTDGDGMYARLYVHNSGGGQAYEDIIENGPGWPRLKSAIHDVLKRYPTAGNAASYLKSACKARDQEEVRSLYKAVADDSNGSMSPDVDVADYCGWTTAQPVDPLRAPPLIQKANK